MEKKKTDISPDGRLYPRRTAFGAVVWEALDPTDLWALALIDEWDRERAAAIKAAKLALIAPMAGKTAPAVAKGPENGPGGKP